MWNAVLAIGLTLIAIVSLLPAIMSCMMFDAPGSHKKIGVWLAFGAVVSWFLSATVLAFWSWLTVFGLVVGPSLVLVLVIFAICVAVFWLGVKVGEM